VTDGELGAYGAKEEPACRLNSRGWNGVVNILSIEPFASTLQRLLVRQHFEPRRPGVIVGNA
jgi:hypothetical protein